MGNFRKSVYELLMISMGLLIGLFPLSHRVFEFPSPVFQDDYVNLSYFANRAQDVVTVRPLTFFSIWFIGRFGDVFFYATIFLLLVLFIFQVHRLSARYLYKTESLARALTVTLFLGLLISFFENTYEYTTFTGVISNLISANLVMPAIFLLLKFIDSEGSKNGIFLVLGAVLYGLSLLAKEDFAALPLVICSIEYFRGPDPNKKKNITIGTLAILATGFAVLMYNFHVNSPFLFGGSFYQHSKSLRDVASVFVRYVGDTRYSKLLSFLWICGLLVIGFSKYVTGRREMMFYALVPLVLIAPFLALRDHIFLFYAMNWLPFAVETILFSLTLLPVFPLLFFLTAISLAKISSQARYANLREIHSTQTYNKKVVEFLSAHRDEINSYSLIGVTGMCDHPSPWSQNDVLYLKERIKVFASWKIFCPRASLLSTYYNPTPLGPKLIDIPRDATLTEIGKGQGIPFLTFDPTGNGKFFSSAYFQ